MAKLLMVVLVIGAGVYAIRMTLLNPEQAASQAQLRSSSGKTLSNPFATVQKSSTKLFCLEEAKARVAAGLDFQLLGSRFPDAGTMELEFEAGGRQYSARCKADKDGIQDFSLY
ncbi:hypothetical protein [Gallaecimonas sp. GXIMD4217]|uniref:hypothetical protein n=1 Tax=Gallaecimonas sp. GXIMD4217 TaxID=3131927 RepID=UPI00311AF92D